MQIKQDPVTGLWARSDGAVLLPPTSKHSHFKKFRWTFGCKRRNGYLVIKYMFKQYTVHGIVCRAFHGLPPVDKPFCDHKNRIKSANFASNLHWVSAKENEDNKDSVDKSVEKYGVRSCENRKGYDAVRIAKMKAQGFSYRKGPDGKWGWYPRIRS